MREIPRLAVSGATVFDGTGRPPIENATVLIEGDRVVSVGSAATTPIPRGATIIDGKGKFVTPGLVDMHVHVYTHPRNGIPSSSWPPASPRCSTSAANFTTSRAIAP